MTRWARSGNTQKHKKMPGDATPWREFSKGNANRHNKNKEKRTCNESANFKDKPGKAYDCNKMSKIVNTGNEFDSSVFPEQPFKKQRTHDLNSGDIEDGEKNSFNMQNYNFISENNVQNNESERVSVPKELEGNESIEKNVKQKEHTENFNKFGNKINNNFDDVSETKVFNKKKMTYMEKLSKKRAENGILLLPSKVERRLYNIKRALRRKNVPPELIKDIIRKERRKEELKFRKIFNPSKACFNCRKPGHMLADCPVKLGSSNQETGICFKCGSVEHTSFKCASKVQGFPFAKCFICKEQGHISRDCPSNAHGVYPKGGRCNLCGNVNHLKKDCPNLKKKKEESVMTLPTISEVSSVEAEITEKQGTHRKLNKLKKAKIVKF